MFRYLLIILCILLIIPTFSGASITKCQDKEESLNDLINEICRKYDIEVNLVKAIIRIESAFEVRAVNGTCKGLMQLSKATAKKYGVTDVFCARQNIEGGVKYISYLTTLFKGNKNKAIAAYNTGEANVLRLGIQPSIKKYVDLVWYFKHKYDKRDGIIK